MKRKNEKHASIITAKQREKYIIQALDVCNAGVDRYGIMCSIFIEYEDELARIAMERMKELIYGKH